MFRLKSYLSALAVIAAGVNFGHSAHAQLSSGTVNVGASVRSFQGLVPLGGAGVTVWDDAGREVAFRQTHPQSGHVSINLPPGRYQVQVLKKNHAAQGPASRFVNVEAGLITYEFFTFNPIVQQAKASLKVKVLAPHDLFGIFKRRRPVANATVTLWDGRHSTNLTTGPNGMATFANLNPGQYDVVVLAPGYRSSGTKTVFVKAPVTHFKYYLKQKDDD